MTAEESRGRRIARVIAGVLAVPPLFVLALAAIFRQPVPSGVWLRTLLSCALAWFLIKGYRWARTYIIVALAASVVFDGVRLLPLMFRFGGSVMFLGVALVLIPTLIDAAFVFVLSRSSAVRADFERDANLATLGLSGAEPSVAELEAAANSATNVPVIAFGASLVVILLLLLVIAGFVVDRNRRLLQPQITTTTAGARAGTMPAPRGPAAPAQEDCVRYDPASLTIRLQRPFGNYWQVADRGQTLDTFASREDADNALALASRYTMECFIGRRTNRANRTDYLLGYWKSPKLPTGADTTIANERCTPYTPSHLRMNSSGPLGWVVTDGAGLLLTLDNEPDAAAAIALARQHRERCWIGQYDDHRAVRISRVDYWK